MSNNGTVREAAVERFDELELTPVQRRIMDLLRDRQPHWKEDVLACLGNEDATMNNLYPHMTYLRRKLNPIGYDVIVQQRGGSRMWRLIIL